MKKRKVCATILFFCAALTFLSVSSAYSLSYSPSPSDTFNLSPMGPEYAIEVTLSAVNYKMTVDGYWSAGSNMYLQDFLITANGGGLLYPSGLKTGLFTAIPGATVHSDINFQEPPVYFSSAVEQKALFWIGDSYYGDNGGGLHVSLYKEVAPVPVPSTLLLLGSGLAGLVGISRWRFKK